MKLRIIQKFLLTVLYYGLLTSVNGQHDDSDDSDESDEVDPRIIGGRPAKEGEAPYQLALIYHRRSHACGATLVYSPTSSEQIAITASHCVTQPRTSIPVPADILTLRGDTLNRNGGQTRNVVKVVVHEKFRDIIYNDIAILFFDRPFDVSPTFHPVDIPVDETDGQTDTLTVSGWGKMVTTGGLAEKLQILTVPVISNEICAEWYTKQYGDTKVIMTTVICGGLEQGGQDACQGDSGGPAVGKDSLGMFLAGVVSWGKGCAEARSPGVYTKVSQYVDWIASHTRAYEERLFRSNHKKSKKLPK